MTSVIRNRKILVSFLEEVLKAIASSQNRSVEEAVYPILENNVDKLNLDLIQALQEKGNALLTKSQSAERIELASILTKLGDLLNNFNQGKRAKNLEICICCYQIARKLYTRKAYPYEWATIKKQLGLVYSNRIQGNNPKNKEIAIKQLNLALKVFTKNHFPIDWAETQVELAKVYTKRIKQKKLDNYIQAFTILKGALNIYKRENYPYEWAVIQDLLGKIYIIGNINNSRQEDTEQAIEYYQKALEVFTPETYPNKWAITTSNLSYAYASGYNVNVETSIRLCQSLLKTIARDRFPYEWAYIQRQLGFAYAKPHTTENNPQQAIKYLKAALEVFTLDCYPEDWAFTNPILGMAYFDFYGKRKGEKKYKYLAVEAYQEALKIYTYENHPEAWAGVNQSLAKLYMHDTDNRKEKTELAIQYCKKALKVFTAEEYEYSWATINNYLGNIYKNRIKGNKAKNEDLARKCYHNALQIYQDMGFGTDIFKVKKNLGLLYLYSVRGDRLTNLQTAKQYFEEAEATDLDRGSYEWIGIKNHLANINRQLNNFSKAIKIYGEILSVHAQRDDKWAWTQRNLGNLCLDSPDNKKNRDRKRDNVEKAIKAYQLALEVYDPKKSSEQWAQTQSNLGNAYLSRVKGRKQENLRSAIECYQLALKVHTHKNYPYQWAKLQNNLGNAYKNYNIKQAIKAYEAALDIYQPQNLPYDCYRVAKNLGYFAFRNQNWEIAIKGYSLAVEATEIIRSFSITDHRRQEIIKQRIEVYQNLIQACINAGQTEKAIVYIDRSRARQLVDLMAGNDLYSEGEISPKVKKLLQEYEKIQRQIEKESKDADKNNFRSSDRYLTYHQIRKARLKTHKNQEKLQPLITEKQKLWEEIRQHDSVLAAQIKVDALNWNEIQQLLNNSQTAILSFYTTRQDTYIFILYRDKSPQIHICHGQGTVHFQEQFLRQNWLVPYQQIFKENDELKREDLKKEWIKKINDVLGNISKRLKLDSLVDNHLQGIQELIIIPYLYLHQIPFSALPLSSVSINEEKREYLGDKFGIRYIPSCQILQFCQQRESVKQISYGTVEDAQNNLPGARIEGEKIARLFNISLEKRLIGKSQATVGNYRQLIKTVEVIHSSHHAVSDLNNPLESALKLADGNITLQQLMTPDWRLPKLHDVFLACCETHLGVTDITEDILTLATGFLCAGARAVVSSLWVADDMAATLLSIFYHQFRKQDRSRTEALQLAQQKLRNLPGKELQDIYEQQFQPLHSQITQQRKELRKRKRRYAQTNPEYDKIQQEIDLLASNLDILERYSNRSQEDSPFKNPFYWAVFTCAGLN